MKSLLLVSGAVLAFLLVLAIVKGSYGETMVPHKQEWAGTFCQGPAMFDRPYGGPSLHQCQDQGDGTSVSADCDDIDGLTVRFYGSSNRCTGVFETRWTRVHQCINQYPRQSFAMVCHNTSYTQINPPVAAQPIPGDGTLKTGYECKTASTCPAGMPYVTFWSNNGCQGSPISSKVIFGNMLLNHCYLDRTSIVSNLKATCSDGKLRISSFQSGCDGTPFTYEEVSTDACISHGSSGSHKVYCGH